jgi:UDP-glucose 4-epimerase
MEARTVLVTGGAGFIGSHVCLRLLRDGFRLRVLDDLSSGQANRLPVSPGSCELIVGDVRDQALMTESVEGCQAVVHLAAEPSVQRSIQNPTETHAINYVGTLTVLEAMRTRGVKRLLYASSAAVYPRDVTGAVSEDDRTEPASPYGLDKLAGEHLLRIYRDLNGIAGTSLRFFNVYGERQDPRSPYSGVISLFAKAVSENRPLTVFGTGEQCRDFVYAGDVASVISAAIDMPEIPGVLNVATGSSITLLQLIRNLEQLSGRKADVRHEPARVGDIFESRADVSRLTSTGIPVPSTSLPDGLRATLGANS